MDINNHSQQQQPLHREPAVASPVPTRHGNGKRSKEGMWRRAGVVSAIVLVVVLLIGVIGLLYSQNTNTKDTESKYIFSNKLQAVFLNTGQVYFGNIGVLNNNFLTLTNIFYLQTASTGSSSTSTTSSNSNVTLVKLGCELHMPYDQMVINRSQVTFWENLQSNGQVATAVAKFEAANPNGQKCADQSSASGNTSNNVQSTPSSTKP